jgi:hypothetical protein
VFLVDALTFVFSAVSLALLRIPRVVAPAGNSSFGEFTEGLRAVTGRRWYFLNLVGHAIWNFAIAAFFLLGPRPGAPNS